MFLESDGKILPLTSTKILATNEYNATTVVLSKLTVEVKLDSATTKAIARRHRKN